MGMPHPDDDGQIDPQSGYDAGRGQRQGVLDCKRAERDYPEASPGAFKLCHELGAFQSDAEETWRGFV